jgi:4,5-DOPA dioxygenase extradiol
MHWNTFRHWADKLRPSPRMPVLFLGHGSPMNAIEENTFVAGFRTVAASLPRPQAILCISAHWETDGTFLTAMEQPRTIHDFHGFPPALHAVRYPAPGSPALALETCSLLQAEQASPDASLWGLDHGAWSVLVHLFPDADIPVVQMSLDRRKSPAAHYAMARNLAPLRRKGILIIGSGNMVHNLGRVDWNQLDTPGYAYDWAAEAHQRMCRFVLDRQHQALVDYTDQGPAFRLAVPTPEHYLPLLYTLGLQEEHDRTELFNDLAIGGSLTMTSVKLEPA